MNNNKTYLEGYISEIDTDITNKTSNKTVADAAVASAQSNLPTDIPGYQTKFIDCRRIDEELANLNKMKTNSNNELTSINSRITSITADKVIADAELATAASAL